MTFNTCKCQDIFRTRFTGASGIPFRDYGGGKKIKAEFLEFADLARYRSDKNSDMVTYYYKSVLSLAEGLACVSRKNYTWATIKLYYSTYFGLRAALLSRNYVLVRALRYIYYFEIAPGAAFQTPQENTDHGATIEVYQKIFGTSDFMCIDEIDGVSLLSWFKNCREIVNYKDEVFHDPEISDLWRYINQEMDKSSLVTLVDEFVNKKHESCVSGDTAVMAIPINRMLMTAQEIRNNGISAMTDKQKEWIRSILTGLVTETFLDDILV